jgi:hypothetical protein
VLVVSFPLRCALVVSPQVERDNGDVITRDETIGGRRWEYLFALPSDELGKAHALITCRINLKNHPYQRNP